MSQYQFTVGSNTVATVDDAGKFLLRDDNGSLEKFDNPAAFIEHMGMRPTGGLEACIEQIKDLFGSDCVVTKGEIMKNATAPAKKATTKAAPAKPAAKAAKPAAKPAAKSAKPAASKKAEVLSKCLCGCGATTKSRFAPGHDARVHGWFKKVINGQMKKNELPSELLSHFKEYEVKHG